MMLGRLRADAEILRATRKIASVEKERLVGGPAASWETEMSFSGLEEDRREALIAAMRAKMPPALVGKERPRKDDDLLHGYYETHSCSLLVAGITGLIESSNRMEDVDITDEELIAGQITLDIAPTTPTFKTPVIFNRLQRYGHGIQVAAAILADERVKHHLGASTYSVQGFLSGLDEDSSEAISCMTARLGGFCTDGCLDFDITAENVGSGIGALLLCLRELDDIINLAPLTASLKLVAVRSETPLG